MEQPSSPRPSAVEISSSPPRHRRPSNAQAGPSGTRKRRRLTNQTVSSSASQPEIADEPIAIDLTDVDGHSAIAKVLAKQREDAVTAQQPDNDTGSARTKLTGYKCPVCMDTPTDATTTVCGHLFCHQCIVEALKIGEERADNAGKTARGTCPVCRKPLARQDSPGPRRTLVPLEIRLTTKKKSAVAQLDVF
ncbi:hypothetical protein BJY01DRAFT_117057 [Aspergillus pseudoustus]|uniref:RING-type domain-containing protein n=1 Tax=Aspergillus pseudoustus TaxID=1810923 RepID=A0ABR4KGX2_9EURO